MKLILDIPEKWFEDMVREEFIETDELCALIQHSMILDGSYSNATNGDVITTLFSVTETYADESEYLMKVDIPDDFTLESFDLGWWNKKYNRGIGSKI